jgi:hypothetical protein
MLAGGGLNWLIVVFAIYSEAKGEIQLTFSVSGKCCNRVTGFSLRKSVAEKFSTWLDAGKSGGEGRIRGA